MIKFSINQKFLTYALLGSLSLNAVGILVWGTSLIQTRKGAVRGSFTVKPENVVVATVKQEPMAIKERFSGTLSQESVTIVAETPGRIKNLNVKPGQTVKKGDLLIELEDSQARASLAEAEGQYNVKAKRYGYFKSLGQMASFRKRDLEESREEMNMALAMVNKQKATLENHKIRAPMPGVVGLLNNISVGSYVEPRQELSRLVSVNQNKIDVKVIFTVPEADASYLKEGQSVDVSVPSVDPLPIAARITAIDSYAHAGSHTVRVEALLRLDIAEAPRFRDGMHAEVEITIKEDPNAIVIPREAVAPGQDRRSHVFVVINGRAVKIEVFLNMRDDSRVQVTHGLKPGQIVITDPVEMMTDGRSVKIMGSGSL
jgi:membrane fusion protein, multidrug efflux system